MGRQCIGAVTTGSRRIKGIPGVSKREPSKKKLKIHRYTQLNMTRTKEKSTHNQSSRHPPSITIHPPREAMSRFFDANKTSIRNERSREPLSKRPPQEGNNLRTKKQGRINLANCYGGGVIGRERDQRSGEEMAVEWFESKLDSGRASSSRWLFSIEATSGRAGAGFAGASSNFRLSIDKSVRKVDRRTVDKEIGKPN